MTKRADFDYIMSMKLIHKNHDNKKVRTHENQGANSDSSSSCNTTR